jgi:hypothetical protein
MREAHKLFDQTEQGRVLQLYELRRAVEGTGKAIERAIDNFATAVKALVKAADALDEPPFVSFRALVDDLASLPGATDVENTAWTELTQRMEAVHMEETVDPS